MPCHSAAPLGDLTLSFPFGSLRALIFSPCALSYCTFGAMTEQSCLADAPLLSSELQSLCAFLVTVPSPHSGKERQVVRNSAPPGYFNTSCAPQRG